MERNIFIPKDHALSYPVRWVTEAKYQQLKTYTWFQLYNPIVFRIKPKTVEDAHHAGFYKYFTSGVGMLLLAVVFLGQNLSSAKAYQYQGDFDYHPYGIERSAVPFVDESLEVRRLLLQWHLNGQRSSLARYFEHQVVRYVGEQRALERLRRDTGELGICVGLVFVFFAFHGRLIERQRQNDST